MNLTDLTYQMEENNRSNYEIERHTRNARGHLLEIKKTAFATFDIQSQMLDGINSLVSLLKGNALADLEKAREMGKGKGAASIAAPEKFTIPESGAGGALGLALGAAALAIGVGVAALVSWGKTIKAYVNLFTPESFKKSLALKFAAWGSSIDNFKARINGKIFGIGESIANFFESVKGKFSINADSKIAKAVAKIGVFMSSITNVLVSIKDIIFKTVMKPINIARYWFSVVGNSLKSFGGKVMRVAGILGKVFVPFGIIMTAWETIQGAIDGFASGGILGGLQGAIEGFFTSIITVPLDLITDAVGWLLGKMGFDKEAKALKDFSFTEIFTSLTDSVFGVIRDIIDWFKEGMSLPKDIGKNIMGGVGAVGDMIDNFAKSILNSILPRGNAQENWWSTGNLISKAIPSEVYDYAGINPKTFENTADFTKANPPTTGQSMAEDVAAMSKGIGFAGTAVANSGNTTDNSTTQVTVHTQMPSAQSNAGGNRADLKTSARPYGN